MKFACDRCHKRFSTSDEPVAGRVYRIPCKCGNTIVVQIGAAALPAAPTRWAPPAAPRPRRSAPPPIPAPPAIAAPQAEAEPALAALSAGELELDGVVDDPFARAQRHEGPALGVLLACASEDVTPTVLGALARRDPDAPLELSSVYDAEPPVDPFEQEIRRTRTHALALGGATGGAIGAFFAAVMTLVLLRPWSPAAAGMPAPAAGVPALVASHGTADRQVAARKPPVVRAPSPVGVAARQPPAGNVAPSPSPSPPGPPVAASTASAPIADAAAPVPATVEERAAPDEEQDARAVAPEGGSEEHVARAAEPRSGPAGGAVEDASPAAEARQAERSATEPAAAPAERIGEEPIAAGTAAGPESPEP